MSDSEAQRPGYRTLFVSAKMFQEHELKTVRKQVDVHKRVRTEGVFRKQEVEVEEPIFADCEEYVPTGQASDTIIDIDRLAESIEIACNSLDRDGYEVHSITPVICGSYDWRARGVSSAHAKVAGGFGYGYSLTQGAVITGRLRK